MWCMNCHKKIGEDEDYWKNYKKLLNGIIEKDLRIAELEEQLKNAIVPNISVLGEYFDGINTPNGYEDFPKITYYDIIEFFGNPECRYICNDECGIIEDDGRLIIYPNEDFTYNLTDATKVWRECKKGDYILIWIKPEAEQRLKELKGGK